MPSTDGAQRLVELTYPSSDVALLTIDNPPRNAFSRDVSVAFVSALDEIASRSQVRSVVVTGTGRSFTSGADLREQIDVTAEQAEEYYHAPDQMSEAIRQLQSFQIPTIAAINGFTLGGGLELALSCDIRICSRDARFVCSGVNVGLILSWHRLPQIVGLGRAMEMLLTGGMYNAESAYEWGLVSSLASPEELVPSAIAIASTIATKPPLSVAATMNRANSSFDLSREQAEELQRSDFVRLMGSADHHEALAAFLEKRDPIYRGK